MTQCRNHPEFETGEVCTYCGEPFCPECLTDVEGRDYCKTCLQHIVRKEAGRKTIKSPAAAAILAVVPGLGHIYNGLLSRAVITIFIFAGLIYTMSRGVDTPFIPLVFVGYYFFMLVDAYRCARRINETGKKDSFGDLIEIEGDERRASLFWGIFLVVLGVLFQMHNLGFGAEWIFKLWPLILVAFGARVVFEAYRQSKSDTV